MAGRRPGGAEGGTGKGSSMKPGPKVPGKIAKTGEYCPPGSEGSKVYRGKRAWRKRCKRRGHPKTHPGRCLICRRLSDKARDLNPVRYARKLKTWNTWKAKPGNTAKVAARSKEYNARQEVKEANARRQRIYRRGGKLDNPGNPAEVAARLLAKAAAKAKSAATANRYGITQAGNRNP